MNHFPSINIAFKTNSRPRPVSPNRFVNLNGIIFDLANPQKNYKENYSQEKYDLKKQQVLNKQKRNKQFYQRLCNYKQVLQNHYKSKTQDCKQKHGTMVQINQKILIQKAYEQLKVRQLEYLSIIKDLYMQNQLLKKINQKLKDNSKQTNNCLNLNLKEKLNNSDPSSEMIHSSMPLKQVNKNKNQSDVVSLMYQNLQLNKASSLPNTQLTTFQKQNLIQKQDQNPFNNQNMEESHIVRQISNKNFESQKQLTNPYIDQFWKKVDQNKQGNKIQRTQNKKNVTFVDSLYNSKQIISQQCLHSQPLERRSQSLINIQQNQTQKSRLKQIASIINTSKTLYHPTMKQLKYLQQQVNTIHQEVENDQTKKINNERKDQLFLIKRQRKHKLNNQNYLI